LPPSVIQGHDQGGLVAARGRANGRDLICQAGRDKWASEMSELGIGAGGDKEAEVDIGYEPPVP
jgi:hypothetical protein